jgi:hypothetical protein
MRQNAPVLCPCRGRCDPGAPCFSDRWRRRAATCVGAGGKFDHVAGENLTVGSDWLPAASVAAGRCFPHHTSHTGGGAMFGRETWSEARVKRELARQLGVSRDHPSLDPKRRARSR